MRIRSGAAGDAVVPFVEKGVADDGLIVINHRGRYCTDYNALTLGQSYVKRSVIRCLS